MVNPFEETAQAARDWNQPAFNARENYIMEQNQPLSLHQKTQQQWEKGGGEGPYPEWGDPTYLPDYKNWEGKRYGTFEEPVDPRLHPSWMEAGITNPNLNGYKVWNAGGVQDKIDSWLGPLIEKLTPEDWEPSRTPWQWLRDWEQSWGREKESLMSTAEDQWRRQNANREFNKSQIRLNEPLAQEYENQMYWNALEAGVKPVIIDGQLYPQFDTVPNPDESLFEDAPYLHKMSYIEPPETIEANLSQTWQTILDKTGSEELANQWLESQQANRGGIIGLI